MPTDRSIALRELELSECFDLLAIASRGRLAITYQALPAIIPVRLRNSRNEVVVSSLLGSSMLIVTPNVVALETGNLGEGQEREWTVQVCGFIRALDPGVEDALLQSSGSRNDRYSVTTNHVRGWATF